MPKRKTKDGAPVDASVKKARATKEGKPKFV